MSACLRCDGCGKAVAEHEDDFKTWWRLTRYGADWIEEPGAPMGPVPILSMHSVFMTPMGMVEMDSMPDFEDDEDDEIEFDSEPSMAVVHFCSSRCLAQWAGQAAALEP